MFSCDHLIDMVKGYHTAGKTEHMQKALISNIYLFLQVQAGGCPISRAGSKVTVTSDRNRTAWADVLMTHKESSAS
jgi:hypothetical protein